MSKVTAYYAAIYLVATQDSNNSKHRVTERGPRGARPGVVQFSGRFPFSANDDVYSTLVLQPDCWDEWFKGRKLLEGMTTPEEAAETLVRKNMNIYYGCPLCDILGKDRDSMREHVHTHINKFVSQFRIEVEK